ncbi:MAG TPA: ABC transporter permease [Thermococcus litoralis]|uniref:ABC transporter permease n=1 Tax=Thermococcus litoralis TaxID=2265 RepID=A0A7C5P160_THELI|nr:ABC transporter permease [Thermococcus litoralis]
MKKRKVPKRIAVAATIISLYVILAIFGPYLTNPKHIQNWNNRAYWKHNPSDAVPTFYGRMKNLPPTEWLEGTYADGKLIFEYNFSYSKSPTDIILFSDVRKQLKVTIVTPLNDSIVVFRGYPYGLDEGVFLTRNYPFYYKLMTERCGVAPTSFLIFKPVLNIIFSKPKEDCLENPELVHGTYKIIVEAVSKTQNVRLESNETVRILVQGKSYGVLGTDPIGRDVWVGFVGSTRESILIAVMGAVMTILFALILGTVGAVPGIAGGLANLISRSITVIPLLPFAGAMAIVIGNITLDYIIETNPLWLSVLLGFLLSGEASRNIRAIVKGELKKGYVESSVAIGGNMWWVLKKHISKVLFPYSLYQLSIAIPRVLALLTIMGFFSIAPGFNWGSMMSQTVVMGATYTYRFNWWQVLPVGISIGVLSISFTLLATWIEEEFVRV